MDVEQPVSRRSQNRGPKYAPVCHHHADIERSGSLDDLGQLSSIGRLLDVEPSSNGEFLDWWWHRLLRSTLWTVGLGDHEPDVMRLLE